ncbi:hypothetical protein PQQ75_25370 [Paraburkholderia aspalathi]|uniref:hypothetical protein n=1 Tax=Paraburkholderia aspalathi TaxID=1324617 RepID=UPI0038BCFDE2
MTTTMISSNGESQELEIVSEPNGTYTIHEKAKPQRNLSLEAVAIHAVYTAHRGERKEPVIQFKAPLPARLDGDAHARIDAAVAKRERKAAKLNGKIRKTEAA